MKALATRLASVAKREGVTRAEAFADFANVSAAGLRRNPREYPGVVKRWRPESVVDFAAALSELGQAMRERPFDDLLGPFYMSFAEGADRGEFYTPSAAARFIGRWALGGYRQGNGTYRVLEPSCGSGVLVLEVARAMAEADLELSLLYAEAWDVNGLACDLAYLNLTTWSVPARVVCGDSLTGRVEAAWRTPHLKEIAR